MSDSIYKKYRYSLPLIEEGISKRKYLFDDRKVLFDDRNSVVPLVI